MPVTWIILYGLGIGPAEPKAINGVEWRDGQGGDPTGDRPGGISHNYTIVASVGAMNIGNRQGHIRHRSELGIVKTLLVNQRRIARRCHPKYRIGEKARCLVAGLAGNHGLAVTVESDDTATGEIETSVLLRVFHTLVSGYREKAR